MEWKLPAAVAEALRRLNDAGYAAYIVGGCVRDRAMGIPPHDWDICTAAAPDDMKKVFQGERTIETGVRHGTLTVVLGDEPLEITAFRRDGDYRDGRHPESVRFTSSIEEDLSRRDFTVNAMAYHPEEGIVDPFGGMDDLKRGIIRCVGAPEKRFGEDALRILRALRFSARLGFPIEENTARALVTMKNRLSLISRERIAAETEGILLGDHAADVLTQYGGVLSAALETEIPWSAVAPIVGGMPKKLPLRLAAALASLGTDGAEKVLRGLKVSRKLEEDTLTLVTWQDTVVTPDAMQYLLMRLGEENLRNLLDFSKVLGKLTEEAEKAASECLDKLLSENACHTLAQLAVHGDDVAALGAKGREIGEILQALLNRVTLGKLPNQKDALLREAARLMNEIKKTSKPQKHKTEGIEIL